MSGPMTGHQVRQFLDTLLGRIRADYPDASTSSVWDGSEVRVEVRGPDGAGVSLTRGWGNLHRADQQVWFEQRLRQLIADAKVSQ